MRIKTKNPANEEEIAEYELMACEDVFDLVEACQEAFEAWRKLTITDRISNIRNMSKVLRDNQSRYASLITLEMGKPIKESLAEIEKCAWMADVYAENAVNWLTPEIVEADGRAHSVIFQPMGLILSIMPWNFPFWQALRFGIPSLIAGNVSMLKHSNTVPACALAIEEAFNLTGIPDNVFRTILADHKTVEELIASDQVQGVSFTGSTQVGSKIAGIAGRNLKKIVLELGGSDPFIVLDDADIDLAAQNGVLGRTINTGQSCIAAKRFIVMDKIAEQFSNRFSELMAQLVIGDPMNESTEIGPLVNADALQTLENQVADAKSKGASVLTGGNRLSGKGYFYQPTVISNVTPDMKIITDEVFAPVAPIIIVHDDNEAIRIANSTEFGLGGSIWTRDLERGEGMAKQIEAGSVFVNSITKSDPRMPFGGVKKSGFGRELAKYGLREFTNIKGLNIYEHK